MTGLAHVRCWNHAGREAAVVCPECRRYFCRECSTEHAGRMMCTACVIARTGAVERSRSGVTLWIALAGVGLMLGVLLLRIPADFHGGAR